MKKSSNFKGVDTIVDREMNPYEAISKSFVLETIECCTWKLNIINAVFV